MLRVNSSTPCKLVYSLCKHEYLGYLIEPHIVQLNPQGDFSFTYQRLFSPTAQEFAAYLSPQDFQIIKLLDEIEQDYIIQKYHKKNTRAMVFFEKHFDQKFYETVRPKIESNLAKVLHLLQGSNSLYMMDKDGWPVERPIEIAQSPASVLFHFRRNEVETRYFPTIKFEGLRIDFMYKNAIIICNQPAWMLLQDILYPFDQNIEGKKLNPFLNKRYISIPKATEATYFEKFVAPLIEKYHVYAEGFQILTEKHEAQLKLKIIEEAEGEVYLQPYFQYGEHQFPYQANQKVSVKLVQSNDEFTFIRIKRDVKWEQDQIHFLESIGLKKINLLFQKYQPLNDDLEAPNLIHIIEWINENITELEKADIEILEENTDKKFLIGASRISFDIQENNDWFDIKAIVYFGPHAIPFIALKKHILQKKREFVLPDGEIAIIPEKWFTKFNSLFSLSTNTQEIQLKKYHIGLINELGEDSIASISLNRKLERLQNFEEIPDYPLPIDFKGDLRPYQRAGYNWFNFLREYNFGGCLADDMGLGKTIQTLALLQKLKEENEAKGESHCSLIIMPTSLIYNWIKEAKKFAPKLKIHNHTGTFRKKQNHLFEKYDVIITTYGISRVDIDFLSSYYFQYIILDESQNIKNPASKSFKAVRQLKSQNRLVLTGTPIENSVSDLWTQLTFLNPGLLGTSNYFNEEYVQAIEKKKDEEKARKLQALIKPFVLRRTKEQVASDLPPKTEQVIYCDMTETQADLYEKTKSAYRNDLMSSMDDGTYTKKQVQILQGLTTLRQLSNHPKLIDPAYTGDSGKFEVVMETLENVLKGGHKVLLFSQFVKQLNLYADCLDKLHIPFAYLDGSTKNRGKIVAEFQENANLSVFLISIKAGGVGLNLTEADYVFILDPWWNPAVEQQAIDRSHRIGQDKKVFIYKFISKDTLEEKILALQNRKKSLAKNLITTEENFYKSLSKEDLSELLR